MDCLTLPRINGGGKINAANPGSKIVCSAEPSGLLLAWGNEYHLVGGKLMRLKIHDDEDGITRIMTPDLGYRIENKGGDYIALHFDKDVPEKSEVVDARLPISVQQDGT